MSGGRNAWVCYQQDFSRAKFARYFVRARHAAFTENDPHSRVIIKRD